MPVHASAKLTNSVDIIGRIRTLSADAPFIMHNAIKGHRFLIVALFSIEIAQLARSTFKGIS